MGTIRNPVWLAVVVLLLAGCTQRSPHAKAWNPDAIPDAYARSTAALMWPGATRAFQVTPPGNLYNGAWLLEITPSTAAGVATPPKRIAYEDRWCPVVRWTRTAGALRWDFEAVALPEPTPGLFSDRGEFARLLDSEARVRDRAQEDAAIRSLPPEAVDRLLERASRPTERDPIDRAGLIVSLRVRVTNTGVRPESARLALAFRSPPPLAWLAPDSTTRVPLEPGWSSQAANEPVLGWSRAARPGPAQDFAWALAAGRDTLVDLILPVYPTPARALAAWSRVPHERRVEQVERYWTNEVGRGAQFQLGDAEVEDAIRAARVVLLSLRERRGPDWIPIGGPFHYRDVWLRDGARATQALAISGYTEESRSMARSFLRFQWPQGPFVSQAGQLDGTGQALWAFEQAMMRPGADPRVNEFAEAGLRAIAALERQRESTRGIVNVSGGMLPVTDPHDNELIEAQAVGNDAWAIAGYRSEMKLLLAAGRAGEAEIVRLKLERYQDEFRRTLELGGSADIPPTWQGGGLDWGNLAVGFPTGALPAGDPRLRRLTHRYFARMGGAGIGYCFNGELSHTYVAADLATTALLAGQPATADSILSGILLWRSASGAAAESFRMPLADFENNLPPHPTSASALLSLVRNAVIYDEGDVLQLTLGARALWWRGSRVSQAPTRWGRIDLSFRATPDFAEWNWTPVPVWTRLRLPPHFAGRGALPVGGLLSEDGTLLLMPPGSSSARVGLTAQGAAPQGSDVRDRPEGSKLSLVR